MRAIEQQKNGFLKSKGPPTFPSHWLWSSNKSLFFLHHANMKQRRVPFMFAIYIVNFWCRQNMIAF